MKEDREVGGGWKEREREREREKEKENQRSKEKLFPSLSDILS